MSTWTSLADIAAAPEPHVVEGGPVFAAVVQAFHFVRAARRVADGAVGEVDHALETLGMAHELPQPNVDAIREALRTTAHALDDAAQNLRVMADGPPVAARTAVYSATFPMRLEGYVEVAPDFPAGGYPAACPDGSIMWLIGRTQGGDLLGVHVSLENGGQHPDPDSAVRLTA